MSGRSEKQPNPHEAPLGKYLAALARPVSRSQYGESRDGALHRAGCLRSLRRAAERARRAKVIKPPREPHRSWAEIEAAWRQRVRR